MFDSLKKWYYKNGYSLLVLICIVIFIVYLLLGLLGKSPIRTSSSESYITPRYRKQYPVRNIKIQKNLGPPFLGRGLRNKGSKGEIECRRVLEDIFGRPFPNVRLKSMRNPVTGRNLELDCYNEELKLAVEYSGRQHYHYTPHFHRNKECFMTQKYRDEFKRKMCKDNGITLIEVPYSVKNIQNYLVSKIILLGYL